MGGGGGGEGGEDQGHVFRLGIEMSSGREPALGWASGLCSQGPTGALDSGRWPLPVSPEASLSPLGFQSSPPGKVWGFLTPLPTHSVTCPLCTMVQGLPGREEEGAGGQVGKPAGVWLQGLMGTGEADGHGAGGSRSLFYP